MFELIDGKVTFILDSNLVDDLNCLCDKTEIKFYDYKYVAHQKKYHRTTFSDLCCPKCEKVIFIGNINLSSLFYCDCNTVGKITVTHILVRKEI